MTDIEGIIYKVFEQYVVLRGFAPIGDLAKISIKADAYQRDADDTHKRDLLKFLESGEYKYFPEIILASRVPSGEKTDENGDKIMINYYSELLKDIGSNDDITPRSAKYVRGLHIKSEYIPVRANRARHAKFTLPNNLLKRVDGNHRLEPFDDDQPIELWDGFDKKVLSEMIVPYSIIFTNKEVADKFEAAIFNNINFKQLPLKQEKNIQNVHKFLKETDELGVVHNLTMKLIDLVEFNHFKGLSHLTKKGNDDDVFRTACFKIAKTLIGKKNIFIEKDEESSLNKKIADCNKAIEELKIKIEARKQVLEKETDSQEENKINKTEDKELNSYRKDIERHKRKKNIYTNELKRVIDFIENAENIDAIEIAIQSLRTTYSKMKDDCVGNLSMLASLVYYKLFDESRFNSFVDWIMKNGIHKIEVNDYLPTHNANSLIALFERIYEAKAKEVFISMQFGDPQSEMIFEKVVQTVEKFNKSKGLDIAITPIRIDQAVIPHSFTIPEEILRAIDGSSLILADLSSCNINVYHEIGYAMGVAKKKKIEPPLILLYKTDTVFNRQEKDTDKLKKDIDKFVGFNLRGTNQLRFATYKELTDQLTERLEAHFDI